jgi:hypothetical protein
MLEALADRLQSASVAFPAQDLFIGIMPDKPDRCVALFEYSGAQPLEVLTDNSATLERPSVQVMVRAARNDYPSAKVLISSVRNTLTGIANETISGERFLRVNQISSINALGIDDNDRPMFTLSLQVVMER